MFLYILACFVVLLGCGALGVVFSGKFKERVNQLSQLQSVMTQLEFDIDFLNITLDESFERISRNIENPLKSVFLYISDRLKKDPVADMQRLWSRAITKYQYDLMLSKEDVDILIDFSKTLGEGNREKEKNNIKLAQMRLKMALERARNEADKNVKMYRGLGFLAGVFIVIVLL